MSNLKGTALITGAGPRQSDCSEPNADNLLAVVKEIKAKGRSSSSHLADVTVEEQVKAMITEVVQVHDGLDVVVANAGVAKWGNLVETSADEWDRIMTVNARGTFLCYKYAALQMVEQGRGGRIIGACSVVGKRGAGGLSAYSASKFAVRGLTQAAALEYGKFGITVNAYAPSAIDSDMWNEIDTDSTKSTGREPGDLTDHVKRSGVLGKLGTSTDVANLVSFIVSKEAQFITGQSLSINGGMYFD
ncbi:Acetoin reductase family protein [Mycena venus]|uniref:Acetoin reductase family protein n=1 Tax=Mycena venus TaxID=2733690 RepID=A0A8H6YXT4_9AGAR|nr:Acetoin reductase family protein [Mycena venus]